MAAQLIKSLVVILLFQMRQFMNHDHPQKGFRRVAKYRRHANFRFSFQLTALHAGNGGMQAERIVQHVDLTVIHHFVDRRRAAQKAVFQVLGVLIQRFIAVNVVPLRIALLQHLAEAALLD